eukprot:IDg6373t1
MFDPHFVLNPSFLISAFANDNLFERGDELLSSDSDEEPSRHGGSRPGKLALIGLNVCTTMILQNLIV